MKGDVTVENLVSKFIESARADGKSVCTLEAYQVDLNGFFIYFSEKDLNEIRYAELRNWVNHMEETGLSASTRARKISSVKAFYRYLAKMEIVDKNPAELLDTPKQEKKQPVVISNDEASDLLFHARNDGGNDMIWFRDYSIIATFLFTGIRREELTNISMNDIDLSKDTILIHGKGNKQRIVYINEMLHAILSEYLSEYRGKMEKAKFSKYLFPSLKADKMCVSTVNNIVNKFFESAGIKKAGISAHILRKRFATSAFQATHDIATVSNLLGHSSPTVTMRYVQMDEDSMRNAAMAVSF